MVFGLSDFLSACASACPRAFYRCPNQWLITLLADKTGDKYELYTVCSEDKADEFRGTAAEGKTDSSWSCIGRV